MNWGFVGYGRIAPKFAESLKAVSGQNMYAIASKSNAEKLREEIEDVKVFNSYLKLFLDKNVDIVYISTPHSMHHKNVIDALNAGKHVICEKPLATTLAEAEEMVALAKSKGLFLMEAMWMRFLPAYIYTKELVESGQLGAAKLLQSDFGVISDNDPEKRWLNPDLAGGSLYDLGVYNITLAIDLFGKDPVDIAAAAVDAETGVDENCSVTLTYNEGQVAQLFSSIALSTRKEATIICEKGRIIMEDFWMCQKVTVIDESGSVEVKELPYTSTGYIHEIEAAIKAIEADQIECELFPHEFSLANAKLVDAVCEIIR